jgi:hypothetical protein
MGDILFQSIGWPSLTETSCSFSGHRSRASLRRCIFDRMVVCGHLKEIVRDLWNYGDSLA